MKNFQFLYSVEILFKTLCNFVLTEFTSSSGQVSNERAASGNWSDEFCLPDDVDTLSQTLSPVIYTVIGGTGMLGVLLLTYMCSTPATWLLYLHRPSSLLEQLTSTEMISG